MRIPQEIIEEIRSSADILEVVSGYVGLKKKGGNYFGLCPFHTEKTPSFSVNPQRQIFHCFGCGEGGNVFTFLMKIDNLQFVEAVRVLAQKLNIAIPEGESGGRENGKDKLALYDVTKFATRFFRNQLDDGSGERAREYLKNRGFETDILESFEIGYAPDSWDALIKAGLAQGFTNDQMKAVGLIAPNKSGGYYDRFRDRIMFPIHDVSGMVVGFGGRKLKDDVPESPKYINSPETAIYQKNRILFGLYQNHDAIQEKDSAILVEGYADVLGLVQAGVKNVVASSGTALTPGQARLLRRYTLNGTILYDGDLAGANAALRGIDVLVQEGVQVKVAQLPAGTDPDSFVQTEGVEALRQEIDGARDLLEFKIMAFTSDKPVDTPQRRAELVHMLAETVAGIRDDVARNLYIQDIANRLKLDETVIFRAVAQKRRKVRRQEEKKEEEKDTESRRHRAERDLLEILLRHHEMLPGVYENLEVQEIEKDAYRVVLGQIYEQFVDTGTLDPQHLLDFVEDPDLQRMIAGIMAEEDRDDKKDKKDKDELREVISEDALRRWVSDCLRVIKIANLDKEIQASREAIRQLTGDASKLRKMNLEYKKLKQRELDLRQKVFIAPPRV